VGKNLKKRQDRRTASTPAAGPRESVSVGRAGEFKPDYTYVIKDLKRIALLAGAIIAGLIVLSFFL
jgi:hypothetical protein